MIQLENVSFTYDSFAGNLGPVLEAIDLTVHAGQTVGIIGPSGCGKSTLLRIVAGLLVPQGGTVRVFGRCPPEAYASRRIGISLQDHSMVPWLSTLHNVQLPADPNDPHTLRRSLTLLEQFGLGDSAAIPASKLSGGMRARAALARALMNRPELLLLDEPFAALDEITAIGAVKRLGAMGRSRAMCVLMVSHNLDAVARLAHRCVCLAAPGGGNCDVDLSGEDGPAARSEGLIKQLRARLLAVYHIA